MARCIRAFAGILALYSCSVFGQIDLSKSVAGCVDCFNFVAPTVISAEGVNPAEVGLIVYDSTSGSFKGSTASGWVSVSGNSMNASAGDSNITLESTNKSYQRFNPTSSEMTVTLGDSFVAGQTLTIKNAGTQRIKVQSDTGTDDIAPVYPGMALQFVVNNNGPSIASHWDVIGTITSDWEEFPLVIEGSVSNPAKGTIDYEKAFWRRVGDSMEIRMTYRQTAAGSAGSGNYLIKIPSGYTMDSSKFHFAGGVDQNVVGSGAYGAGEKYGVVSAFDSTSLLIVGSNASDAGNMVWSSSIANHNLGSANVRMSLSAKVAISGWASNSGI